MTTPSVMPDPATEAGRAVLARLDSELVAWLTTITADGRLQSSAVWFLWADGEFLVFSRAGAPRARNIAGERPRLDPPQQRRPGRRHRHLRGRGQARARARRRHRPIPAYVAKYGGKIRAYGWTPESFSRDYPDPIRIRPTRLRLG